MEKKRKKGKRKKDIALLHTGMLKHAKTFNPIHSDHVNEVSIVLKRGFFLFDIKDGDKKAYKRHHLSKNQRCCVLYQKRQKPLEINLSTLLTL